MTVKNNRTFLSNYKPFGKRIFLTRENLIRVFNHFFVRFNDSGIFRAISVSFLSDFPQGVTFLDYIKCFITA